MKDALSSDAGKLLLTLSVDSYRFSVKGRGSSRLTLSHSTDMVVRKSDFVSDRTLMVHANRAASDLPIELVELLQNPNKKIWVELALEP